MTSYFRGTVDFLMAGTWSGPDQGYSKSILFFEVLTPCIGQNLIDFYFLCMKTDCLWKEMWQVGNAHIDHIDFALIFLFHLLLIKIGTLLVFFV